MSVDSNLSDDDKIMNEIKQEVEIIYQLAQSFGPLSSRELHTRQDAMDTIERQIESWLDGYGSPRHGRTVFISPTNGDSSNNDHRDAALEFLPLIKLHLPSLVNLMNSCPIADVRERCCMIIEKLKLRGIELEGLVYHGPSTYIPQDEIVLPSTVEEQTQMLYIDAFLQNNRLDHITQVMGYHPQYLDCFLRAQNFLLRGDGPLPFDYRHYIAIMAAGRHQCGYLINLQKQEFILQGGQESWLRGLQNIPSKLRDLYEINKILAHRPWLINKSHIEKLTKGEESWSLAEIVHAIVLLAHFHSVSSFVYGCGVTAELDQENGHPCPAAEELLAQSTEKLSQKQEGGKSPHMSGSPNAPDLGVETLMKRMKNLSEQVTEYSQEEKTKRYEKVETQSVELSTRLESIPQPKANISQFIEDASFMYIDFIRRGQPSSVPTFRVQDYSWDDHGFSLVNRLYNDVGNLLDDKYKTAYNLTYYTMGKVKKVDTSRFRVAVWNYIQCMFGIRHDDYDYGEVNQLLERSLKAFIKIVCCYPERITKRDFDNVMREFQHSEKVHVNIMILEARLQAELLYALRAIMHYMT